jgi:hypothetical protein
MAKNSAVIESFFLNLMCLQFSFFCALTGFISSGTGPEIFEHAESSIKTFPPTVFYIIYLVYSVKFPVHTSIIKTKKKSCPGYGSVHAVNIFLQRLS